MKSFLWEPAAIGDLRRLDRVTAMRILLTLTCYGDFPLLPALRGVLLGHQDAVHPIV